MQIANLDQANQALKNFMPNVQTTNWTFSLERMQAFMAELGNPQGKVKIIHVAGTSGKTSTAYYIADMLRRAGKKVGLTVSPHVDAVNERVQLNGQPLGETEFCQLLGEFIDLPAVKAADPSYFGLLIGFAFWVFAKQKVDYAVIEVGLGGRLDSTNVITRADKVCVITDIGLDHISMLGSDVETIAAEKAGIIQAGNQALMAEQQPSIVTVIKDRASQVGAQLTVLPAQSAEAPTELPLFQQRNWSVAAAVVSYLSQRDGFAWTEQQARASAQLLIPARMETVQYQGKTIIIDGAHNTQKIMALCRSIQAKYPNQKLAALVSFSHDKDESMNQKLAALSQIIDHLIITTFRVDQDMPRWSIEPQTVQVAAQSAGMQPVEVIDDPRAAFDKLLHCPDEVLLITGSFYLLNRIRPLMKGVL